ncbi:MAG TPA: ATP-binding protein [Actinomycetota bacterium]|nr:ATP-binding protein [Actinomycetota bacterium]
MRPRAIFALAWGLWTLFAIGLGWDLAVTGPEISGDPLQDVPLLVAFTAFPTVGAVVASRRPGNPIGWLFLGIGVLVAVGAVGEDYAEIAFSRPGPPSALGILAAWSQTWFWYPLVAMATAFPLLLFPSGLPSRGWRPVLWLAVLSVAAITVASALRPTLSMVGRTVPNPIGVEWTGVRDIEETLAFQIFSLVFGAILVAAAASLLVRFRRSRGEERLQLKWFSFAAILLASSIALATLVPALDRSRIFGSVILLGLAFIPIACGIAIVRHRLFDIDLVINRTVVFGALAAFVTGVYVAIVVGLGSALGRVGEPSVALQIAATAVVAVAFQPVRERVQRLANRLVYGERATPYEVMAGFAHRMADTLSVDETLPAMAEVAARGVGAAWGRVALALPDGTRREAAWPEVDPQLPETAAVPVEHRGERVGEIAVSKAPGDPLTPAERRLLEDLASQAGLALRNAGLAAELEARLEELTAQAEDLRRSRERLVTARDEERRRLEREIREGPERHLLTMRAEVDRAAGLAPTDPAEAGAVLEELGGVANATLEELRDLARGIYPPLLADEGVVAALRALVRKAGIEAEVSVDEPMAAARLQPETEAAIYFCLVQALRNVQRHAPDAPVVVRLDREEDAVRFEVLDGGPGFDPAATPPGRGLQVMRDRVEALEGELEVRSAPGQGTRVRGRIPLRIATGVGA